MGSSQSLMHSIAKFSLLARGRTGPFLPASLPNLRAWYRADAGVYSDAGSTLATNGQTVQQWNDQSGNGHHLKQSGSTNRPVYGTASFNLRPGLTFDGDDVFYTNTAFFAMGSTTTASGFMVLNPAAGSVLNDRYLCYFGNGGVSDWGVEASAIFFMADGAGGVGGFRASSNRDFAAVSSGTNYRWGSIYDGSNHTFYVNNSSDGSPVASTGTLTSPGTLAVMGGESVGNTAVSPAAVVAEIVVTASALNSVARQDLDDYFVARWNL
jgi:hypothetical protein